MTAIVPGRRPAVPVPDAADPGGRVVAVRVNLLPGEILDARRGHRVRRAGVAVLALLAVVLGALVFVVRADVASTRSDLAAADSLTAHLRAQQGRYADVVALQDQVTEAVGRLNRLTAGDLDWAPLLTAVVAAAPRGVVVAQLQATTADPAAAGSAGGAPGGGGTTAGPTPVPVGVLTLSGAAPGPGAVAAYVDALARVVGLDNVVATDVSAVTDGSAAGITGYTFGVTAVLSSVAALPTPTAPGGK
ncbi:hypothetical protein ACXR2U_15820 [Jatrophihabitans sp. YIM 134969]